MKQRYFLFFIISVFFFSNSSFAQMPCGAGNNVYLPGHWLEIGQVNYGAFGTNYSSTACPPPAGYHASGFTGLASVYDYGHDGWTTGTPALFGDYTLPGSPFEGWGIQIASATTGVNWAFIENGGITGTGVLTGSNVSYSNTGGTLSAVWQGTAGIGGVLSITQTTRVDTNASWVVVTTEFKNTGAAAIPGIYYMRTCDPDDDEIFSSNFATNNKVVYQNDYDHRVMVSSTGQTYTNAYMSLATKDCRAKALVYQNWPVDDYATNLSTVYTGTAGITPEYTVGTADNGDYAIGLVYDIGTIPAYDSTVISYAYIYNGNTGIDSAFPDPQMVVNGVAVDSVDTFNTCSYPGLAVVPVNIINATDKNWTWSHWTWSPSTGLAATTGVTNTVNLTSLSGPITYTITGTDSAMGACEEKTFILTIIPCFSAANNGPICLGDTLDLFAIGDSAGATYAWYHLGTVISTLQDPVIPDATLADSGLYMVIKTTSGVNDTAYTDVVIKPLPVVSIATDAPICSGSTLTLAASPDSTGETFSWTGPDGFTSGIINPVITGAVVSNSGLYKVYTSLNGCIDSASIVVVIDSTPAIPVAGSNSPICSDSTLFLTATDATAGVIYSWVGPNSFVSGIQDPFITNVTTAASGTYTVTVSLGMCKDSSTTIVNIKATPPLPILSSNAPVCSGGTLNLFATDDSTDVTYSWVGPQGFTSTLQNPSISPVDTEATGFYSVVATLNGCPTIVVTEGVLVDSTPAAITIGSNSPICQYGTIDLTAYTATPGVSYTWTGPLSFSSTMENPTITDANTDASGLYWVTASRGFCFFKDSVAVTVDSIPLNTYIGSNSPICSQGTLDLFATFTPLGGTYTWTGPDGYSITSTTPNQTILDAPTAASGVYTVTDVLGICTSVPYTVVVVVDSTPQVPNAFSNSPVCQNDTLQLSASDGTSGVSYSWSGPGGFTSNLQDPSITDVQLTADGNYIVTATLGMCSSSAATTVSITPTPAFVPTSNSPVCTGDTLFLFANGAAGSTYTWTGPYAYYAYSLAANPFIANVTTENAGVYTVTASLNGCTTSEEDTVVINRTPPPPFVSWLTYCQYYPAPQLMANDSGLTWYNTDTIANPLPTPPTPSTATIGSTFYYLTQTVNGCMSFIDSIQVTVNPTPTVTVTPIDTAVCPHSTYMILATDTDPIAYYHWYPSMYLSDTTTPLVTVTPETNVVYTVVASNQFGCADSVTSAVVVYPAALISLPDSVTLYPGQSYTMNPTTNCTSFSWFPPAGLSNNYIPNPVATPVLSTKYIVYGQTENGCSTSDSIDINISSYSAMRLPNAFTPGNGPNSQFKIIMEGVVSLNYFRVFNRWGQKVFETNNINVGWDGNFNGSPQPFDVYVYEVEGVTSSGQTERLQGNFTLLR